MCLVIVDAHLLHDVFNPSCSRDCLPIREAIWGTKIRLVCGGTKLKDEYQQSPKIWSMVVALEKAGKAKLVPDGMVDKEMSNLITNFQLSSDDPHVIALARVSGARLLCTLDQGLHCDFRDKNLIAKPRGYVYQRLEHKPLISKPCAALESQSL